MMAVRMFTVIGFALALLAAPVKASEYADNSDSITLSSKMDELAEDTVGEPYDFGNLYPCANKPFQNIKAKTGITVKDLLLKFGHSVCLQQITKPLLHDKFIKRMYTLRQIGIKIYDMCDDLVKCSHMIRLLVTIEDELFTRGYYGNIDRTNLKRLSDGIIELYDHETEQRNCPAPVPNDILKTSAEIIISISRQLAHVLTNEELLSLVYLKQTINYNDEDSEEETAPDEY